MTGPLPVPPPPNVQSYITRALKSEALESTCWIDADAVVTKRALLPECISSKSGASLINCGRFFKNGKSIPVCGRNRGSRFPGESSFWLIELFCSADAAFFCDSGWGTKPFAKLFCFLCFLPYGLDVAAVFVPNATPAIPTAADTALLVTCVLVFLTNPIGFLNGMWALCLPSSEMLKESTAAIISLSVRPLLLWPLLE